LVFDSFKTVDHQKSAKFVLRPLRKRGQKGRYQMKRFETSMFKTVLLASVIAVVLTGLYSYGAPYIEPQIGRFLRPNASGQYDGPQGRGASLGLTLAGPLPQGWQAEWNGGELWITHYNPDGSVADTLPFDSVESLSNWLEAHPDCCDVDVDKLAPKAPEDTVPVSTVGLIR
jgi:hypothetical protein